MANQPNLTEQHNVNSPEELNLILAEYERRRRAQIAPPVEKTKPTVKDEYETEVTFAREYAIGDTGGVRVRPAFVVEDNEGWKDVGWTW